MPAFFLTGTDTEVGKTHCLCALLWRARGRFGRVAGMKPFASGLDAQGKNADIEAIRAASCPPLPEAQLNLYRFAEPISPHIAAARAGTPIRFAPILAAVDTARAACDFLAIEGAGGFRIPLSDDGDSADLAQALGLPVILAVGMRLGCINHALLSAEAILARGLPLAGWIANRIDPEMAAFTENLDSLKRLMPAPLLGVLPHGVAPEHASAALTLP
ncbi:MAG: dethiobiotin synthase [Zoogloeaceae bacterium]|jgi:dethiobiotin synthetase|nr:dethiobiotin synthase [Zoogloeaceae bacterium]